MRADEIRSALKAEPFKPFRLSTSGGREYFVPHPEFALLTPSGRTMTVVGDDDVVVVLDVMLIESINFASNGRNRRKSS